MFSKVYNKRTKLLPVFNRSFLEPVKGINIFRDMVLKCFVIGKSS
jgi:hypothetical protein